MVEKTVACIIRIPTTYSAETLAWWTTNKPVQDFAIYARTITQVTSSEIGYIGFNVFVVGKISGKSSLNPGVIVNCRSDFKASTRCAKH